METLSLLWEVMPATVRQVFEAQPESRAMDFATVQTYLRRLEKKLYASSTLTGRLRVYKAKAKAKTVIRDTVDDLVQRLFGGETLPLVKHLIEDGGINKEDISELRNMLKKLEKERP